jgi:hypothetical protein
MQIRADERSITLHRAVARKLRSNPKLWNIPRHNLIKWKKMRGYLPPALIEWERILNSYPEDQILSLLESNSEDAARLRSSSPFTGILADDERQKIFEHYRLKSSKKLSIKKIRT